MKVTALPELVDLVWLFEAEAVLGDPDAALPYNTLFYRTERGDDVVECMIDPGYRDVTLKWWRDQEQLVDLVLTDVVEIRVDRTEGSEALELVLDLPKLNPLRLALKPTVSFSGRMDLSSAAD